MTPPAAAPAAAAVLAGLAQIDWNVNDATRIGLLDAWNGSRTPPAEPKPSGRARSMTPPGAATPKRGSPPIAAVAGSLRKSVGAQRIPPLRTGSPRPGQEPARRTAEHAGPLAGRHPVRVAGHADRARDRAPVPHPPRQHRRRPVQGPEDPPWVGQPPHRRRSKETGLRTGPARGRGTRRPRAPRTPHLLPARAPTRWPTSRRWSP